VIAVFYELKSMMPHLLKMLNETFLSSSKIRIFQDRQDDNLKKQEIFFQQKIREMNKFLTQIE